MSLDGTHIQETWGNYAIQNYTYYRASLYIFSYFNDQVKELVRLRRD